MITTMLAFSFVLQPPTFFTRNRAYGATFFFGLGGLFGWPFCAILGVPFVIEELLVYGREVMVDENDKVVQMARSPYWRLNRALRLAQAIGLSFFAIAVCYVCNRWSCICERENFLTSNTCIRSLFWPLTITFMKNSSLYL